MPLPSTDLFCTMATLPSSLSNSPTDLTKSSTSLVHTDPSTISNLITTQLPTLLPGSTPTSYIPTNSSLTTHSFTHRARTSSTASGKPVFTTLKYILSFTVTTNGLSFTSTIDDGMEEADDATFADVHGQISLQPEPFGTTRVTMSASVQLVVRSEGIKLTSQGIKSLTSQGIKPLASSRGIKAVANHLVKKATAISLSTVPPLAHATLDHLLSCIPNLHAMYARYNEIDDATYTKFERDIPTAPPVRPHENALCEKIRAYDDQVRNGDTKRARARTQGTHTTHTNTRTHFVRSPTHFVRTPTHFVLSRTHAHT